VSGQLLIVIPLVALSALYVAWRSWRTWMYQGKGCGGGCGSACASSSQTHHEAPNTTWIPAEQLTRRQARGESGTALDNRPA
jgi:hypothetical protein